MAEQTEQAYLGAADRAEQAEEQADPAGHAGPGGPADPAGHVGPGGPADPAGHVGPRAQAYPGVQTHPGAQGDSAGHADPGEQADSRRAELIEAARARWIDALTDLGGRNTLLYYKDRRAGTLDLAAADPGALDRFCRTGAIRLTKLSRTWT